MRFASEEIQCYVRIMSNHQRNKWAREGREKGKRHSGYPTDKKSLEIFSGEAARKLSGAPSLLRKRQYG